jgi:hypothetical protein
VRELLQREGFSVGYTTLRRFVHEQLGWRERPVTVRVEDPPPGDEAQIDFGEMGLVGADDGRRRKRRSRSKRTGTSVLRNRARFREVPSLPPVSARRSRPNMKSGPKETRIIAIDEHRELCDLNLWPAEYWL